MQSFSLFECLRLITTSHPLTAQVIYPSTSFKTAPGAHRVDVITSLCHSASQHRISNKALAFLEGQQLATPLQNQEKPVTDFGRRGGWLRKQFLSMTRTAKARWLEGCSDETASKRLTPKAMKWSVPEHTCPSLRESGPS